MTEILSGVSPSEFSWSILGSGQCQIFKSIKLLTSGFLERFGSYSQFPGGGKFPFCPPCGHPQTQGVPNTETAHQL